MFEILAAAAAVILVEPRVEGDFPRRVLPRGSGNIIMRLFVAPNGTVDACSVIGGEVSKDRAKKYCAKTIGEKLGSAAVGPNGEATYGFATIARIRRPAGRPLKEIPTFEPTLEVRVSKLPSPTKADSTRVLLFVGKDGQAKFCFNEGKSHEAWSIACAESKNYHFDSLKNAHGVPVSYIIALNVHFVELNNR